MREKIIAAILGALLGVSAVVGGRLYLNDPFFTAASAADSHSITIGIYTADGNTRARPGDECGYGGVSGGASYASSRQLVVRDADGTTLATSPAQKGVIEKGPWGNLCGVTSTFTLPPSPFYAFVVSTDRYEFTVTSAELTHNKWELKLQTDQ